MVTTAAPCLPVRTNREPILLILYHFLQLYTTWCDNFPKIVSYISHNISVPVRSFADMFANIVREVDIGEGEWRELGRWLVGNEIKVWLFASALVPIACLDVYKSVSIKCFVTRRSFRNGKTLNVYT